MTNETLRYLTPEIILVLMATATYVGGAFFRGRSGWSWLAAAAIFVAAWSLEQQASVVSGANGASAAAHHSVSGPVIADALAVDLRRLILIVGLLFVMMTARSAAGSLAPEFVGSLLLIVSGLMLVASASDLVLLFVGLELVSIPTYVILYLGRRDTASQEAATKYFFLSILSSALLLYGFSFLYGAAGSTQLFEIHRTLAEPSAPGGLLSFAPLALVLIFAGLGFRLTIVPFHFYAPDVYQGTSHPNAGLLAIVPKIAGLAALVRVVVIAMPGLEEVGWHLSLAIAMLTMTFGNLLALWQDNVRRLLAYSSIAHAGYMLIGLAVSFAATEGASAATQFDGVAAALFYLLVYGVATIGAFAALTYLSSDQRQIDRVDDLAGLGRTYPVAALSLAIFMFSLAGLPPLAGFWGKFMLLAGALAIDADHAGAALSPLAPQAGMQPWFIALAVVGVLNAAIAAAYYLRIVAVMYFRSPLSTPDARGGFGAAAAMVVSAAVAIGIGLYPGPLMRQTNVDVQQAKSAPFLPAGAAQASPPAKSPAAVNRAAPK